MKNAVSITQPDNKPFQSVAQLRKIHESNFSNFSDQMVTEGRQSSNSFKMITDNNINRVSNETGTVGGASGCISNPNMEEEHDDSSVEFKNIKLSPRSTQKLDSCQISNFEEHGRVYEHAWVGTLRGKF